MKFACRPPVLRWLVLALGLAASLATNLAAAAEPPRLLHGDHPLVGQLWDLRAGRPLAIAELVERLRHTQVLLLGETHDNPEHHRLQQQLLQARLADGSTPALAMEQFDSDRQAALDQARQAQGDADALARAGDFARAWDWPAYRPFVVTALDKGLPLIAANLSRQRLRPVIRDGFAAFDTAELARLQVDQGWSASRQSYLAGLIEASHCGQIDATLRDGLVRSQRLRDAAMADVMVPQLARGVVAIIGRGHARRDIGVPHYLELRQPGTKILALGFVEVSPDKTTPDAYDKERVDGIAPYDVVWFTARADRPDPCANFGKRS